MNVSVCILGSGAVPGASGPFQLRDDIALRIIVPAEQPRILIADIVEHRLGIVGDDDKYIGMALPGGLLARADRYRDLPDPLSYGVTLRIGGTKYERAGRGFPTCRWRISYKTLFPRGEFD